MKIRKMIAGILMFALAAAFIPGLAFAVETETETVCSQSGGDVETVDPQEGEFTEINGRESDEVIETYETETGGINETGDWKTDDSVETDEQESDETESFGLEPSGSMIKSFSYPENHLVMNSKGTCEEVLEKLPEYITVTMIDGETGNIPVNWFCQEDYDNTDYSSYIFDVVLPKSYKLYDLLNFGSLPYVEVEIDSSVEEDIYSNMSDLYRVWTEDKYGYDIRLNGRKELLLRDGDTVAVSIEEYGEYPFTDIYAVNGNDEYPDMRWDQSTDTCKFVMSASNTVVRLIVNPSVVPYGIDLFADTDVLNTYGEPVNQTLTYYDHSMWRVSPATGGYLTVGYFEMQGILNQKNTGIQAFCCRHSLTNPEAGDSMYISEVFDSDSVNATILAVRKILYYGYGGPGQIDYNAVFGELGYSKGPDDADYHDEFWRRTSLALSYILNNDDNQFGWGERYYNEVIADKPAPPDNYAAFILSPLDSSQPLAYGKMVQNEPGAISLKKISTYPAITENNASYSLQGAVYTVYTNSACTDRYGTMTTDASGNAVLNDVPAGTYYVRETTASKGFQLDTSVYTVDVETGKTASFTSSEIPLISVGVTKLWSDQNNKFGVRPSSVTAYLYSGSSQSNITKTSKYVTLNASNNWTASISGLPQTDAAGNNIFYCFKEDSAPAYYLASFTWPALNSAKNGYNGTVMNTLQTGFLKLVKTSSNTSITSGNQCYSLVGAEYTVYKSNNNGILSNSAGILTVQDEQGNSNTLELIPGTYYVKETKNGTGYQLDQTVYTVNVTSESTAALPVQLNVTDMPDYTNGSIIIHKLINGEATDQCLPLTGTQFTVNYYDGYYTKKNLPDEARRSWVIQAAETADGNAEVLFEEAYKVSGDDFYRSGNTIVLPLGTITIQETKPAPGYTLNGYLKDHSGNIISTDSEIYVTQITEENGAVILKGGNEYTVEDTPLNGSVRIVKYDSDGNIPLAGVDFALKKMDGTIVTEGTTDENGTLIFDDLYPDQYILTETATVPGHSLLPNNIEITIPMGFTEEEVNTRNIDKEKCIYNASEDTYYVYDLTYEVSNGVTLILPATGGFMTIWTWIPLILAFMLLLTGVFHRAFNVESDSNLEHNMIKF